MGKVEWIKLNTDMFSNPKIKKIRRLPEGNNILLIWIMLLTMAGRCNASGMIFISEHLLYTPEDLADELGFSIDTIKLAIRVFEEYGMVITGNNGIEVANWELYQSAEGLESIRKYERENKAKYREKQRQKQLEIEEKKCPRTMSLDKSLDSSYSYSKYKSNLFNLNSLLEDKEYIDNNIKYKEYILYILDNQALLECLRDWFEYKDGKKDKYSEKSILTVIKKFAQESTKHDVYSVVSVVETAMSSGWKGVVWEKLDDPKYKVTRQQNDIDELAMMLEAERSKNNV